MADELIGIFGTDWAGVEARVDELLEQGRRRVVRWRWASSTAQLDHPAPLWAQRDGEVPVARLSDVRPSDVSQAVNYGYDASERLVFSSYVDRLGEIRDATTWVSTHGDDVQLYFSRSVGALRLRRVAIPQHLGDRLVGLRMLYDPREALGDAIESYDYDDAVGGISRIVEVRRRPQGDEERYVYDVVRDDAGDVVLIRFSDGIDLRVVYRRRDPNAVRSARRRVEKETVELTLRWARRLLPRGSVRAIAFVYGVDEPGLPPALAAATGPSAATGEERYYPAEFEVFDADPSEFRDPAFREDCRVLTQEWRFTETESEPRSTVVKIAKRLAKEDWWVVLGQHDPPIVYAVDEELDDLRRNLRSAGIDASSG